MKIVLSIVLVLCSCNAFVKPVNEYDVSGTVRNVWSYYGDFHITFEHDTGESVVYVSEHQPPLWAGEHVQMHISNVGYNKVEISNVRRLQ